LLAPRFVATLVDVGCGQATFCHQRFDVSDYRRRLPAPQFLGLTLKFFDLALYLVEVAILIS
jgi:hypothetical protein